MRKFITYIIVVFFVSSSFAFSSDQRLRNANWCFGNGCWLDFSSGNPETKEAIQLETSEGVATMSDENGQLLFYTDGRSVWTREYNLLGNHRRMRNADKRYAELKGDESSTQSAIIFPAPGDDKNKYYIVTADEVWNGETSGEEETDGLNYYVVDMSKNRGYGEVVSKDNKLADKICEKVTAIGHENGKDYWLVTQLWGENKFRVFLVNENGIEKKGDFQHNIFENFDTPAQTKGYLKFSASGSLLASANNGVGLFIYNFDRRTGVIDVSHGNVLSWRGDKCPQPDNPYCYPFLNVYGVEFSPSEKYLYVSSAAYSGNYNHEENGYVFQLDLSSKNVEEIKKSIVILETRDNMAHDLSSDTYFPNYIYGAVQLAIDGKIYIAWKNLAEMKYYDSIGYWWETNGYQEYLAAINNVEEKGIACNYEREAVSCDYGFGQEVQSGLPTAIQSFYLQEPDKDVIYDECEGGMIRLEAEELEGYEYKWILPDGTEYNMPNPPVVSPSEISDSGIYTLISFKTDEPERTLDTAEFEVVIKYLDYEKNFPDLTKSLGELGARMDSDPFSIKNNSEFEMEIESISLAGGSKWGINIPDMPMQISPESISESFSCYCLSDEVGTFEDKLIIEISKPCPETIEIPLSFSTETFELYVQLPDTISNSSELIKLPLKAKINKPLPEDITFNLTLTWNYLADVYSSYTYQTFDSNIFFKDSLNKTYEYQTAKLEDLALTTDYQVIAYIAGCALHNNPNYTSLTFDLEPDMSFASYNGFNIIADNGSIESIIDGCMPSDIMLNPKWAHAVIPSTRPIGSDGELNLYSPDDGELVLQIYNLSGEVMDELRYTNSGIFHKSIQLDWTKYSNGTYLIVWTSPKRTYREALIINK